MINMPGSVYVCCLCGSDEFGYGNNPAPLDQMPNRCCDACNYTKVIPARIEMMFAENRGFSSEDSQDEAAAAIIGGIFTVSMGALLEQLAKALNEKDAPAATFFKDCIDYMAMSMVSSYEENTKNFPKEVKYAIDMTLGMTAKQFSEWEQDPSFEELTNLGSSENPDVETMSEVVLDEAKEGYDDDFSVMYSSEDELDPCIGILYDESTGSSEDCGAPSVAEWGGSDETIKGPWCKDCLSALALEPECDHLTSDPGGRCTDCGFTEADKLNEREGGGWEDCPTCGVAIKVGYDCRNCSDTVYLGLLSTGEWAMSGTDPNIALSVKLDPEQTLMLGENGFQGDSSNSMQGLWWEIQEKGSRVAIDENIAEWAGDNWRQELKDGTSGYGAESFAYETGLANVIRCELCGTWEDDQDSDSSGIAACEGCDTVLCIDCDPRKMRIVIEPDGRAVRYCNECSLSDYNAESYVPLGEDHWDLYWLDSGSKAVTWDISNLDAKDGRTPNIKTADRISKKLNNELEKAFNKVDSGANPQTEAIKVWHHMEDFMSKYADEGARDTEPEELMVMWINDAFHDAGYKDVYFHRHDDDVFRWGAEARQGDGVKRVCHRDLTMHCNKYSLGWVVCPACNQPYTDEDVVTDDDETDYGRMAESYADFFTQMEELLESTTIAGGWTLDATTDQEDPDAVTMVVKFKPTDPSTFFDIIE